MATIDLSSFGELGNVIGAGGTVDVVNANTVNLTNGIESMTLNGTFDVTGTMLTGGTLTGYDYSVLGETAYTVSGISVDAATAVGLINAGSITGADSFLALVEAGSNTIVVAGSYAASDIVNNTTSWSITSDSITNTIYNSAVPAAIEFLNNGTVAGQVKINNQPSGVSYLTDQEPYSGTNQRIREYSSINGGGTLESQILDQANGQALLYAYNPQSGVVLTEDDYSSTAANGAPTGSELGGVVDLSNGQALVYQYNPQTGVVMTEDDYSATTSNGGGTGAMIGGVVDLSGGQALVYQYNPQAGVLMTETEYSQTGTTGAGTGPTIGGVIDLSSGQAWVYQFNLTGSVVASATEYSQTGTTGAGAGTIEYSINDQSNGQAVVYHYTGLPADQTETATWYPSYDSTTNAGTGTPTQQAVDFNAGFHAYDSLLETFDSTGSVVTGTTYYTGVGSGSVVSTDTITAAGSIVNPGTANTLIQFVNGATNETVTLNSGAIYEISGFNPTSSGDLLDLRTLLSAANVSVPTGGTLAAGYLTVQADAIGDAQVYFDPTGHGATALGNEVAVLTGDGGLAASIQAGKGLLL